MPSIKFFIVPDRRCPYDCGGNGTLVYLACPGCGRIVLLCDEIGNVFDNLSDLLASSPLVIWRSAAQCCPGCQAQPLANFTVASQEQLLSFGVAARDFAFAPDGMPLSLATLTKA